MESSLWGWGVGLWGGGGGGLVGLPEGKYCDLTTTYSTGQKKPNRERCAERVLKAF